MVRNVMFVPAAYCCCILTSVCAVVGWTWRKGTVGISRWSWPSG